MAPPSLSPATDSHPQPQSNGYTASIDTKHYTYHLEMGETMSLCRFDEGSRIEMTRHPLMTPTTTTASASPLTLRLQQLEEAIKSHLLYDDLSKPSSSNNHGDTADTSEPTATTTATITTTATSRDSCYYYASSPPLQIRTRFDAHWLECRRPYRMLSTVFGMEEEEEEEAEVDVVDAVDQDHDDDQREAEMMANSPFSSTMTTNAEVQVEVFHPTVIIPSSEFQYSSNNHHAATTYATAETFLTTTTNGSSNHYHHRHPHPPLPSLCSCRPPHREWKLQDRSYATQLGAEPHSSSSSSSSSSTSLPLIRWMDLRSWQRENKEPFLTSPAAVTHFLRSLLGTSHDASLWVSPDGASSSSTATTTTTTPPPPAAAVASPSVVALLLTQAPSQLLSYRVGDASPSYYLHSVAQLQDVPHNPVEWWRQVRGGILSTPPPATSSAAETAGNTSTLLVYRQLLPRDQLSICHPKDPIAFATPRGCLWETYYYRDEADATNNNDDDNDDNVDEKETGEHDDNDQVGQGENLAFNDNAHVVAANNGDYDDNNDDDDGHSEVEEHYRLLAPPYVSCDECYPGVLDPLLTPQSLAILRQEAMAIAHWTAWPEKQHYRSTSGDASNDSGSAYPASWTVFPLCYCFPANDPSALKWIPKTCQLVPETVKLLQHHVGSKYLRTALFSRLDPETTLEPHVGWADLANHVLRIHIPLVVPPGGLCGTWVDGCVETHEEGRPICLDDGKLHRAFNYSQQPRIVLIVDLARPSMLPLGTATGGHSDELDQFIEQMGGSTS